MIAMMTMMNEGDDFSKRWFNTGDYGHYRSSRLRNVLAREVDRMRWERYR